MVGHVYAKVGEVDLALEWLERAYAGLSDEGTAGLLNPPLPERLGSNPRNKALLKKVGFKDYEHLLRRPARR